MISNNSIYRTGGTADSLEQMKFLLENGRGRRSHPRCLRCMSYRLQFHADSGYREMKAGTVIFMFRQPEPPGMILDNRAADR